MKFSKSITDRIEETRAAANAFIDGHVARIAKECPGVPASSIRNSIVGDACACSGALKVVETIERDVSEKETAA